MVKCSCGKVIDKLPDWLSEVKVQFVCTNCPNRAVKSIAHVTLEVREEPSEQSEVSQPREDEEGEGE